MSFKAVMVFAGPLTVMDSVQQIVQMLVQPNVMIYVVRYALKLVAQNAGVLDSHKNIT